MLFDEFWQKSILFLKDNIDKKRFGREDNLFISGWRSEKGIIDEKFPIHEVTPEKIICRAIHTDKQIDIRRTDMAALYSLWDEYIHGGISRLEIAQRIPRTQYAISLMKYLKENIR